MRALPSPCLLICLWVQGSLALGNDNVLGLPKPSDPRRPGALVLHGGGPLNTEVFERFVELAGGASARIIFVPSAGYRPSDYPNEVAFRDHLQRRFRSWVSLPERGQARQFSFLYTDNTQDADDENFVRPLRNATGIWFCGGSQARLNYRFVGNYPRQTLFQKSLRGILERGGVVGGTSAGMAALPEIMTISERQRRVRGPINALVGHGFGLLSGAIVEQHFDGRNGRIERFTGLLRDDERLEQLAQREGIGARMVGLAVEERTALIIRGDELQILGIGNVHVFLKSPREQLLTWHTLAPRQRTQLRRQQDRVLLVANTTGATNDHRAALVVHAD